MTYNAKLVPMDYGHSYHIPADAIVKYIDGSVTVSHKILSLTDGRQAQRLVITSDDKPQYGKLALSVRGWIGIYGATENSYENECSPIIATYPNMPDVPQIDLSDIRRWIDEGCKESVELEVTEYFSTDKVFAHTGGSPMAISPNLTDNTVKMVLGEQDKAQPIDVSQVGYMQTVPNSHQFTLCGLQQTLKEFTHQLKGTPDTKTMLSVVEYMLIGIENSIKENREILPHHPATDWEALLSRMQNNFGRSDEYEQIFDFIKNEINGK